MAFNIDEKMMAHNRALITRNSTLAEVKKNYLNYKPGMVHYISHNKSLWLSVAEGDNLEKSIIEPLEIVTAANFERILKTSNAVNSNGDIVFNGGIEAYIQPDEPLNAGDNAMWMQIINMPLLEASVEPLEGCYKNDFKIINPIITVTTNANNFRLKIFKNNQEIYNNFYEEAQDLYVYEDNSTLISDTEYRVRIYKTNNGIEEEVECKIFKYNFVLPLYLGTIDSPELQERHIDILENKLLDSKELIYIYNTKSAYMCIAYPSIYGGLESIKDANIGYELIEGWNKSNKEINSEEYIIYTSEKCTVENYKIRFK